MASYDGFSALLWDVVLGEVPWDDALAAISTTTAGASVFLLQRRGADAQELRCHRFDMADLTHHGDSLGPSNAIEIRMSRAPVAAAYDRRDLICDATYARDPAMEVFRRQGVFHGLIANLERSPSAQSAFWIGLPEHRGDDCQAVSAAFTAWIRPLQRALTTQATLARSTASFSEALTHLGVGAAVVDTDLRILDTNAEAERIAKADDGIGTRRGRLTIGSGSAQRALDRRLRTLWRSPAAGDTEALRVARPSGLPDYRLDVVPARGRGFGTILICDPVSPGRAPDPYRLASRLGLTAAEARVAGLAPLALTKAEIADRLGLSENTVRSHLRSARSKLGARNMVELALIVRTAG